MKKTNFMNPVFIKYGEWDLLDEDAIGDMEEEKEWREEKHWNGKNGSLEEEKVYSSSDNYASWDMYKEHLEPYKLDVIGLPPDRDWKRVLDIHTQDPHLRKLLINEKLMLFDKRPKTLLNTGSIF
jgi:hypothetical protein